MAFTDDILGMVLIVIVFTLVTLLVVTQVVLRGRDNVATTNQALIEDHYVQAFDTFLHFQENVSQSPFNILLGDYIFTGKRFVSTERGVVDVKRASERMLDTLYGRGNYYVRLRPSAGTVAVSFVIDSSKSLEDERMQIGTSFDAFFERMQQVFNETDTPLQINIYILSDAASSSFCAPYVGKPGVTCDTIGFGELYDAQLVPVTPPAFGMGTYAQWLQLPPYATSAWFSESDWVAGAVHAQEAYLDYLARENLAASGGNLHIIIPITDELSTSSIADRCFTIRRGGTDLVDYTACALCDDTCPVTRASTHLNATADVFAQLPIIVIGVYSYACSFTYNPSWSSLPQTPITDDYIDFPIQTNVCDEPRCGGCDSGSTLQNYCFHANCRDDARAHLELLANATGGGLIDVQQVGTLADQVLEQIEQALERRVLEIGTLDEDRTRYVFTRDVLLPQYGTSTVTIRVYETPFIDRMPPVLFSADVQPWMARNGTRFRINASILDNSTLPIVQAAVRMLDGSTRVFNMTDALLPDEYEAYVNSSGWYEGDYWVSISATDASGNSAQWPDATWFRINDSDAEPPVIHRVWADPAVVQLADGFTNLFANVTDNIAVERVTVRVTGPAGTSDHTLTPLSAPTYGVTYDDADTVGTYTATFTATDTAGLTDTATLTFTVNDKRARFFFVPIGWTSQSSWDAYVAAESQYFLDKLPFKDCADPASRAEFIAIDANLCDDLTCQCHCDDCAQRIRTCYDRYRAATGDNEPYELLVGVTDQSIPAGCPSLGGGVGGCVAGLGNPVSSSRMSRKMIAMHEAGHSLGLCHVGPLIGGCGAAAGVGAPHCPNKDEQEVPECMMNYCHFIGDDQKRFCPVGYSHLKGTRLEEYMEGC